MARQLKMILLWGCRAMLLLVCIGWLLLAVPAQAQDDATSTMKRIEQLRDQAGRSEQVLAPDRPVVEQPLGQAVVSDGPIDAELPANELLPLGAGRVGLFNEDSVPGGSGSMSDDWLLSTLAALGVVLAIVFGLRWVLKRGGVVSSSVASGSVVEVLNRTTVAPRSHVVLMRVGQRILVVSDSSAGMRTLASVHEPEEVAELLGAVEAARSSSVTQNFGSVMKKLSGQWLEEEDALEQAEVLGPGSSPDAVGQAQGALSQVRGRLASLAEAGGGRA